MAERQSISPMLRERDPAARKLIAVVRKHELTVGLAFVLLVFAVSLAISAQGWQSRMPAFDLLTYHYSAHRLLDTGTLPQHGDTGSYGSYKPPGTAWLMVPGTILIDDPRLSDYVGTGLLHLATLLGLFFLGRKYFGSLTACGAAALYALSATGLYFAGALWPNGRPDFFILTVLLASQWVSRRDARFLAAALAVWGLGMFVDMAIAPVLLVFPALWLYYRPPVRLLPIVVAGTVLLIVWSPYLQLELQRGFSDIRSQLFLQNLTVPDPKTAWCDPGRDLAALTVAQSNEGPAGQAGAGSLGRLANLFSLIVEIKDKGLSNFSDATPIPLANAVLALLVLLSLLWFSVPGAKRRLEPDPSPLLTARQVRLLALGMLVTGALIHELLAAYLLFSGAGDAARTIQKIGLLLGLSGAALVLLSAMAGALNGYLTRHGIHVQTPERGEERRLLAICLLVPWFILLAVAEPGKPERFWWLWPLQVLFLSAFAFSLLPRLIPRRVALLPQLLLVGTLLVNPPLTARLESWREAGWAGSDAEEEQVVDYVAGEIGASARDRTAIGYEILVYPFMVEYHVLNPVYKVGAVFDLMFKDRYGIVNANQCAEGLSPFDEFRIVQTQRQPASWQPRNYFVEVRNRRFELVQQFGEYQVWQR